MPALCYSKRSHFRRHVQHDASSEREKFLGEKFCREWVLLHAVNLRHRTDGFTSPPKEGVLRIFSPLKFRPVRLGLNPRTWVLKANTLPLDRRSRYLYPLVLLDLYFMIRKYSLKRVTYSLPKTKEFQMYLFFHPQVLFQSTAPSLFFALLRVSATYSCHHQGTILL